MSQDGIERGTSSSDVELALSIVTAHETLGRQLIAAEAIRQAMQDKAARIVEDNPDHFTDD